MSSEALTEVERAARQLIELRPDGKLVLDPRSPSGAAARSRLRTALNRLDLARNGDGDNPLSDWPDEDWCDASIAVGDVTVRCSVPGPAHLHAAHRGAADHLTMSWDDDAPGAN